MCVVCYVLCAVCCVLCVVCYVLRAVCCVLYGKAHPYCVLIQVLPSFFLSFFL